MQAGSRWTTSEREIERRGNFPFRKQAMPFSRHSENFLTINKFFSAELEKKGNYMFNHPASKPEPLLLHIPFIPLHYQVDPPIFRKILLQSVTFLNVNDRVAPNNKQKLTASKPVWIWKIKQLVSAF